MHVFVRSCVCGGVITVEHAFVIVGPISPVERALDLRSRGPSFESRPGRLRVVPLGMTLYQHCSNS